jgi:amino acid adenylation domain-containing protein
MGVSWACGVGELAHGFCCKWGVHAEIACQEDIGPDSAPRPLGPAERQWLETVCQGRSHSLPTEPVHRLIELQAAAAPDAIAIKFRHETLTYRELNRRANQLAHYFAGIGIGPEDRVVVCVEPAFDIVIALLATLKVGAAYVPLDPSYPVARIRTILDDTRPKVVVTRSHLIEKLPLDGVPTLTLDAQGPLLDGLSGENPNTPIDLEQTAYVYYTSGTTGAPKGVMASHRNLASYIQVAQTRYQFTNRDVMPAIARFSFSISMFELMSPLVAGGTLVILERDHILDFARMSQTLSEITFFHAGPGLLKSLLSYIKRHDADFSVFSRVRHASSGGDMVPPEMLEALREIFFNAEVFVIYGCTEISCMGCTYPVPRDGPVVRTYVGRPFDNMILKVTDGALNPVPVGAVGEILFAGAGIVKGYLNRPDLTAEKFVEIDGKRFYRTGDMGRISEEGWLELLGRSDFQVKLRGMRIELGDVEHNLRRAPGVRDGVVVAREVANGERALVAYVVMDAGDGKGQGGNGGMRMSAVRRHMAEQLPDYMVPAIYVELPSLPLNHNMKVDRRALPAPEREHLRAVAAPGVRPPETPTERRLASLWQKLLGIDAVGLDDNFFELGGHSMLALKLILELDSELGVVLEGMEVLRESLEVQANICDGRLGKVANTPRPVAPTAPAGDASELFHFGQGRSLYGVLHGGSDAAGRDAVLICSPVGQEYARTHFVLQRLARQLAARGVPTLRFDYYGCGDSLGDSIDGSSVRWQRDIGDAYAELKRRTNATRITAIGVRLGATLLCGVAGSLDLARLVLWDPVCQGSEYLAEMAEAHRQYLCDVQHLRFRRPRARSTGGTELLGSTYSETALRELNALVIVPIAAGRPMSIKWLATSPSARQTAQFRALGGEREGCRIETMDFDCSWQDVSHLEDILPDVGITRRLAEMGTESP